MEKKTDKEGRRHGQRKTLLDRLEHGYHVYQIGQNNIICPNTKDYSQVTLHIESICNTDCKFTLEYLILLTNFSSQCP